MEVLAEGRPESFNELVHDDVWVSTGLHPEAPI
jgi:hypothetical protein